MRHWSIAIGTLAVIVSSTIAFGATPTFIESADGKRLVKMDDPTVETAYREVSLADSDKASLYIEGNNLLKDVHDPAVLVVDGDVRHTPAGVKIAVFDGENVRHGDSVNGKILMNYHHPDLCPDASSNRVYRVVGPELTQQQLVAVLYVLKPEMFTLTKDEEAAQQKAIAEAGAESDRLAAQDHVAMNWMVLNGQGPIDKVNQGMITFSPKVNGIYPAAFDYTKDGGPALSGVAASQILPSSEVAIWAAFGSPKSIGLCVYKIDGGKLAGEWHPWYDQGDPKNVGTESLEGPASLDGVFKIVSAKAPTTGAAYAGTVAIKPMEITGAADDEKPYSLTWTIGTAKVQGIGIRTKDYLYVASGTGADTAIAKFIVQNGSFHGDFFKLGSTQMGSTAATSMN